MGTVEVKLVILEGISGCGKSTLIHPVGTLSNYRDTVVARFTPSTWVYNTLYNRERMNYEGINEALQTKVETHVVWLSVYPPIALRRQKVKQDERTENLEEAHHLFQHYFKYVTVFERVHIVSSWGRQVEDTLEEIRRKVYGVN